MRGLGYPYLFDDFDFLERAQRFRLDFLLPDPSIIFFRPISREIYFGLLHQLSPEKALLGHLINAALIGTIILLTSAIAAKLAGSRAGIIAGIFTACFSQWPVLIDWVSGAQDLLAIVLTLGSVYLALVGRMGVAYVFMVCGLLAKETAVAAAPALVAIEAFRPQATRKLNRCASIVGLLLIAWALIHPGVHLLAHRGTAPTGHYIGLNNAERWSSFVKSLLTLCNFPIRLPTSWPAPILLLAVLLLIGAFAALRLVPPDTGDQPAGRSKAERTLLLGFLLSMPPLLLTCLLVRIWSPYYLCFSAPGVALILALGLRSRAEGVIATLLGVYFIAGVWSRGVEARTETNELALAPAARALTQVEHHFKLLEKKLSPDATVYVTTMARGSQSIYVHLHRFQALRVWYNEPSVETLRPELAVLGNHPEYLFVVTPDLNVAQIDLSDFQARTAKGRFHTTMCAARFDHSRLD